MRESSKKLKEVGMDRLMRLVGFHLFMIFFVLFGVVNESKAEKLRVAGGQSHTLWVKTDGTLWAWGLNDSGQLGDGANNNRNAPIQIGSESTWVSVSAGGSHSLGLKSDGTLWAWGLNNYGQLGDGTNDNRNAPIQIGSESTWVSVSAGGSHSLGLKADGTLWAWGYNNFGQLGDGTTSNRNLLVQIGSDKSWVAVSGGASHSLGLKSDGTLWAWGHNDYGQVGDGTRGINRTSPVEIAVNFKRSGISAGGSHSLGLKSDGTLWAWGWNNWGQLGDSTITLKSYIPVKIGPDNNWVKVSAGYFHSLALKSDGTLWAWGGNDEGQLGDGTTTGKPYPVQIGSDNNWVSISAGYINSFGMKADGTLWGWGDNHWGQLGDDTKIDRPAPVQIGSDNNWVAIAANNDHEMCIKSDGTLWAWGENVFGQLGDGTIKPKISPIQIGSDKWVTVAESYYHSHCLRADGTLWAWGRNDYGQLGDGTEINKNFPDQIAIAVPGTLFDLIVSTCTGPTAPVAPGQVISLLETTKNQGNGPTAVNTVTRYFWSTDPVYDASDLLVGERVVGPLAAGAFSGPVRMPFTIPSTAVAGTYYIIAKADAENSVAETSEANNTSQIKVRVGAGNSGALFLLLSE
jgi:alpha-tubulin suppressor-like RCC1 family protein